MGSDQPGGQWHDARRRLRALLSATARAAHAVRLGEVAGRVVEVDRIDPDRQDDESGVKVLANATRTFRLMHPEGAAADLVVPRNVDPSPQLRRAFLSAIGALHDLTPRSPAQIVVVGRATIYRCPGAAPWLEWPPWSELLQSLTTHPGRVIHQGAIADLTPLDGSEQAILVTISRAPTPAADPLVALTASQRTVVEYAAAGATLPEIARARDCSLETVRSQLKEAYRRLGVASRAELANVVARAPST
jgi:DNA-binding CsgD family transcriptional regulator